MRKTTTASAGLTAALLAIAAMQLPKTALALNPQPEVPSKPNPNKPNPNWHKKYVKSSKSHKHLPPSLIKN